MAPIGQREAGLLNVGLIVDSDIGSKYVYGLAEWGQKQPNLRVSTLLVQDFEHSRQGSLSKAGNMLRQKGVVALTEQITFTLLSKAEKFLLKQIPKHRDHFNTYSLKDIVPQTLLIKPQISPSGYVFRYLDEDVERVKALNLDILVRCGSGILRGGILYASRFGILSFHHGDNRVNRGGPPGFWEVYFRHDTTGFIVQRLTEELDGGQVLLRGQFPTQFFSLLNQAQLYKKSNVYLMRMLSSIAAANALPEPEEPRPYFDRLFRLPGLATQLSYTLRLGSTLLGKAYSRLRTKRDLRWGVAFSRSDWKSLVMWRAQKLPVAPNHFIADPFLIGEGGRDFCFLEDYDYLARKGSIAVYEIRDHSAELVGEALVEPFHLSFPYLFRFDGKLYMCPETSQNHDIRLYECVDFPLRWELRKVVMEDVSAADTMIFQRDGLWWMLTNMDPSRSGDHCSELFAFWADNPISTDWTPHPKNPLLIDSSKARNAGLLFDSEFMYRVGQRQGFNLYGKGFTIHRIKKLTKRDYEEEAFCSIEPRFFPGLKGTHHLHSDGRITVFDYLELGDRTKQL